MLSAATSAGAQLRALAVALRERTRQWLGVAVKREFNTHADTLSHPRRWEEVAAEAKAAGYVPRRLSSRSRRTKRTLHRPPMMTIIDIHDDIFIKLYGPHYASMCARGEGHRWGCPT